MALRKLRLVGDEILQKTSKPLGKIDDKTRQLLDDMLETMRHQNGVGLAAVQIGVLKRILVIDAGEENGGLIEMVNPQITYFEGTQEGWEGCLSVPGHSGLVERPLVTVVKAQDRFGQDYELRAEGTLSVIINHEMDHLNGLLYTEKASEMRLHEDDDEEDEG